MFCVTISHAEFSVNITICFKHKALITWLMTGTSSYILAASQITMLAAHLEIRPLLNVTLCGDLDHQTESPNRG